MQETTQIVLSAADLAGLAYSVVFLGGVISGWAFILGMRQRF